MTGVLTCALPICFPVTIPVHALMSTALNRDGKLIVFVDKAGKIAINGVYPPEEAIYFHEGE